MNTMLSGLGTIGIPPCRRSDCSTNTPTATPYIRQPGTIADHDVEATTRLATTLLSRVLDVIATTK